MEIFRVAVARENSESKNSIAFLGELQKLVQIVSLKYSSWPAVGILWKLNI